MSLLGGEGPYCISILWGLTALLLVFLGLRVYTRVVCVASYGIDDTFYIISNVIIVIFAAFGTVACLHGYGRDDLDPAAKAEMVFWRLIAQALAMVGTATSKASVGFFLLRLIAKRWHKIVIWTVMGIMTVLATLAAVLTWIGCSPIKFMWDERIEGGTCINSVPVTAAMAVCTIMVDVVYAGLAWIMVWNLSNPLQEKIILGGSLGLGIFAAVAGTLRLFAVRGVREVPIAVIIWSQVELTTTLVCVGIPVCLPLWRLLWRKVQSLGMNITGSSTRRTMGQDGNSKNNHHGSGRIGLYTIGGTPMTGVDVAGGKKSKKSGGSKFSMFSVTALDSGNTQTGTRHRRDDDDGSSDEVKLTSFDGPGRRSDRNNDSSSAEGY